MSFGIEPQIKIMVNHPWLSTAELEQIVGSFLQTYPCEAVAEVTYCPTKEKLKDLLEQYLPIYGWNEEKVSAFWERMDPRSVAFTLRHPYQLGLRIPQAIGIRSAAISFSKEELVSIIRDHEYIHAQDWFATIPINSRKRITLSNDERLSDKTIKAIIEVRAYKHQLQCMPPEWKDKNIRKAAIVGYIRFHSELQQTKNTTNNNYEKRLISDFLRTLHPK